MVKKILLINGPNLNMLGSREPSIYGSAKLKDIEARAKQQGAELNALVSVFQSNHEGAILDRIHQARGEHVDAIIINPGAFTHTSVALRDALLSVGIRFIEIHITNIFAREAFRHHSYLSDKADAVICGMGVAGYEAALTHAVNHVGPKL